MFFQVPDNAAVFDVGKTSEIDIVVAKILAGKLVEFTDAFVNLRLLPAIVPFDATLLVDVFQAIVMLPMSWCAAPAVAPKT
jgi:hypothetical protein